MKLKKLVPLLQNDFLISDLDEQFTYSADAGTATLHNAHISKQLEKKIISVSSFYDQVLVKVKLQ